ncbi:MAG: chemotaxis protein CheW [Pyrinomonadaceae bacterium]
MNDSNPKKKPIFDLSALNLPDLTDSFSDDKQHTEQSGEKFIVFALDDELFAVSSNQVAEVTRPLAVTPLPNVPEWLLGIANLRGEIISVADLQKILGKKISKFSPKSKFVIVRSQNSGASIAFTIHKLSELVTLSNEEIQTVKDEKSPHIFGKAAYKSNTLQLIDLVKLFASLELRAAKTQA